jgi:SAM-dependent methyltransferase
MNKKTGNILRPITIFRGLPGTGKSRRLIQLVNAARAEDRHVVTFACSDSPRMNARESVRVNRILGCRQPGLICQLDHFASTAECIQILQRVPQKTLVAFEEAHYFSPEIVPHWGKAAERGLEVLVCMPSDPQLELLKELPHREKRFKARCECCKSADASTFIILPGEDATLMLCKECDESKVREVRGQIVQRLQSQAPYPGQKTIYQPVELAECKDWNVLRPDSPQRVELMTRIIREAGLLNAAHKGNATYLDVGCNTGYFCHKMHQLGFFAQGVDVVNEDIEVARLLDSYIRRDQNTYVAADAYRYLTDTEHQQVDVTSAFAVFQWVMIQTNAQRGIACLEKLFAKTKHICFLEMGYSSEDQYKGKLPIPIDQAWVMELMKTKGGFSKIEVLSASETGLMRDLFVGWKQAQERTSLGNGEAHQGIQNGSPSSPRCSGPKAFAPLSRLPGTAAENGNGACHGQILVASSAPSDEPKVESDRQYKRLLARIKKRVCSTTPAKAIVAVVSENEESLLSLKGRQGWHFLQTADKAYAGHHPANGSEAVTQLELLRKRGAQFFVLPSFSFWWQEYYPELRNYLEDRCVCVWSDDDCQVYALSRPKAKQRDAKLPRFFDQLIWLPDRLLLNGLVFRLEHFKNDNWELGDECFRLFKTRGLLENFGGFFASRPGLRPRNLLELGTWDGGSIVLWNEWLRPRKHMAVDVSEPRENAYFERYLVQRGLHRQVKRYWRTNQGDSSRIQEIVAKEFDGPLDMVIDDASHKYGPTKSCFETLFPLLRPGGLYVIEDWAWGHWPEFQSPNHGWANEPPLTDLVVELIESTGTRGSPIQSVLTYHGFTVIERGSTNAARLREFKLEDHISRRPAQLSETKI